MSAQKTVHVAVGIVQSADRIFLTQRATDAHQGGKWEFPGGKVEAGETAELALSRELQEEIGITVLHSAPFITVEHDYGDKTVKLDFYLVSEFTGQPRGCEGQLGGWFVINELADMDFPAANQRVIELLLLP